MSKGYTQVHALLGGWNAWVSDGGPTEPVAAAGAPAPTPAPTPTPTPAPVEPKKPTPPATKKTTRRTTRRARINHRRSVATH
ncbi:MAG: hypothetical protein ACJ74W_12010 [Pyrinomonadaceae bacterium]